MQTYTVPADLDRIEAAAREAHAAVVEAERAAFAIRFQARLVLDAATGGTDSPEYLAAWADYKCAADAHDAAREARGASRQAVLSILYYRAR